MKARKVAITLAVIGGVISLLMLAVSRLRKALETFAVDDTEDDEFVPPHEGWVPQGRGHGLSPEVQKIADEALASYPEGWVQRERPRRPEEPTE